MTTLRGRDGQLTTLQVLEYDRHLPNRRAAGRNCRGSISAAVLAGGMAALTAIAIAPVAAAAQAAPVVPAAPAAPEIAPPNPETITPPVINIPPPPDLLPNVTPTLPPGTTPAVPITMPITINQAVNVGLQRQPNVLLAAESTQAAVGRTREATSALLPSFSVSSSYNRSSSSVPGSRVQGSPDSYSTSLSARQLLFDFGRTKASVASARDQEAATRAGESRAREDAAFNIQQAYYQLLEDQRLQDVAQLAVNAQRAHLAEAQAILAAGKGAPLDVFRAQASLADALLTLANAQNTVNLGRTNLNIAMGIDVRTPTQVVDPGPPSTTTPDLNPLVARGLANRPEVLQAQKQVAASEADLRGARTGNLPSVEADGSLGESGIAFPGPDTRRSIGVNLSWDIFDSGLTSGRVQAARAALASAQTSLFQTQQTVSNDITQAFLNTQNAEQRVITSAAQVASAQQALNLAEGRYRAGVGIFLEITDAQSALVTAQANQVDATYTLDIAQAALQRAIGAGPK